jgi:23S rRNA (cytosine1962-C5)-methyltransferase
VGAGIFNPRAKIPLRVVAHGAEPIGEDYFERAIRSAVALRRDLLKLDDGTDAYRLINSDGDGLSGLTIDRYADVLLCEVMSLGIAQRLPKWLPLLHELAGTKYARVQVDHDLGSLEGIKPSAFNETNKAAPRAVKIRENGVRYEVDFAEGHKTGFFCDQRENRRAPACSTCAATRGGSPCARRSSGAPARSRASTLTRRPWRRPGATRT